MTRPPTLRQVKIYALLTTAREGGGWRTQAEICKVIGTGKGRISANVRSLVAEGYMMERGVSQSPKYYKPGPNHRIMEEYIRRFYGQDPEFFLRLRCFDQVVTPPGEPDTPEAARTEGETGQPYVVKIRSHLNGGWITFRVIEAGEMVKIEDHHPKTGQYRILHLFGRPPTQLRGLVQYNTSITWDGHNVGLRYQRTASGEWFGVCASEQIVPVDQADDITPHLAQASAILHHLEARGGWKFARDDSTAGYQYTASVRTEHGMPRLISDAFTAAAGTDKIGVPGVTPIWSDNSVSGGEVECTDKRYTQAIYALPHTRAQVAANAQALQVLRADADASQAEYYASLAQVYRDMTQLVEATRTAPQTPTAPPTISDDRRGYV